MKKLSLLIILSFFVLSCGKSASDSSSSSVNSSSTIDGSYEASHNDIDYELWVESIGVQVQELQRYNPRYNPGGARTAGETRTKISVAVLLFQKSNANLVRQTLRKYQTTQTHINDVCEHIKNSTYSTRPELVSLNALWNKVGAYGQADILPDARGFVAIESIHHISFEKDNEYAIKSIHIDSGSASVSQVSLSQAELFKPELFTKNPLNYFVKPEIELNKTSSSTPGLLKKYFESYSQVLEHFETAREQGVDPCA